MANADGSGSVDPPTVVPQWLRWLRDVLFPAPVVPQRPTRRTVLGYLLGFVAAVVYLLVIPAGRSHLVRVWGEDGVIFMQEAFSNGFLTPIFTPYAGYLHLLPRLAAEVLSYLPVAWWAAGLAVTAAVLRAAMAVLVYAATSGHVRSQTLRLAIAAAMIVLPAGNNEALNNLANLHWFVFFAAFWTLLWRPTYRWQSVVATLGLVLFVLTTPLGVLLAPLAAVRLALPRRRDRAPAIAFFLGLAAALVPILTATRPHSLIDPSAVVVSSAARGPLVTFTGSELAAYLYPGMASQYERLYAWPALLAVLLVCGLAGIAIVRGNAARRGLTIASLLLGSALILMSLYKNWEQLLLITAADVVLDVQRYSAGPCLFFFTGIVLGLAGPIRSRWRYAMVATRVAVIAVIATGVVYQWQSDAPLLKGITWSEAMAEAKRECASGETEVKIKTIPETRTFVTVPCTYLR
ncbi:MAG: hypothetical protein HKP61_09205 [Dactylosporangium sp.]|nr:hypothetical protein [Dactylosporangium sp.]NNJ61109.1 hypothetical protein [Dactylosporangium sp.]